MLNIPLCAHCALLEQGLKCKAFPNGIPKAVYFNKHAKKIEGQQGDYVFKPIKEDGQD